MRFLFVFIFLSFFLNTSCMKIKENKLLPGSTPLENQSKTLAIENKAVKSGLNQENELKTNTLFSQTKVYQSYVSEQILAQKYLDTIYNLYKKRNRNTFEKESKKYRDYLSISLNSDSVSKKIIQIKKIGSDPKLESQANELEKNYAKLLTSYSMAQSLFYFSDPETVSGSEEFVLKSSDDKSHDLVKQIFELHKIDKDLYDSSVLINNVFDSSNALNQKIAAEKSYLKKEIERIKNQEYSKIKGENGENTNATLVSIEKTIYSLVNKLRAAQKEFALVESSLSFYSPMIDSLKGNKAGSLQSPIDCLNLFHTNLNYYINKKIKTEEEGNNLECLIEDDNKQLKITFIKQEKKLNMPDLFDQLQLINSKVIPESVDVMLKAKAVKLLLDTEKQNKTEEAEGDEDIVLDNNHLKMASDLFVARSLDIFKKKTKKLLETIDDLKDLIKQSKTIEASANQIQACTEIYLENVSAFLKQEKKNSVNLRCRAKNSPNDLLTLSQIIPSENYIKNQTDVLKKILLGEIDGIGTLVFTEKMSLLKNYLPLLNVNFVKK